jgi:hypothetical protein
MADLGDLSDKPIDDEVREVLHASHRSQLAWLENLLAIPLDYLHRFDSSGQSGGYARPSNPPDSGTAPERLHPSTEEPCAVAQAPTCEPNRAGPRIRSPDRPEHAATARRAGRSWGPASAQLACSICIRATRPSRSRYRCRSSGSTSTLPASSPTTRWMSTTTPVVLGDRPRLHVRVDRLTLAQPAAAKRPGIPPVLRSPEHLRRKRRWKDVHR